MDELTDYSSPIIEFKPALEAEKQQKLVENCTGTDPLPAFKDISLETNLKRDVETQTQARTQTAQVDERKLALWLRKICPFVESELDKGPTPINTGFGDTSCDPVELHNIQTYQKITMDGPENSQGLATWLSVFTNNAPLLVVSTVAPHDDWCEHVNQSIRLFVPKRPQAGNFVVFTEEAKISIPACLRSLSTTNPFNKNIFAGSTMNGEIYVWQYEHSGGGNELKELCNAASLHSHAVAMDWASETRLLTAHSNGFVVQWALGKQLLKETQFQLKLPPSASNEITTMICLDANKFVVGTKDGGVYYCWNAGVNAAKENLEVTSLHKHLFTVSSLLKAQISSQKYLITCDLSGQVVYHDIRDTDDEAANVVIQIPLPFKNAIACSQNGGTIYCPGNDGCLECYRVRDGVHSIIKGALRGKGNFIKCSNNGCWIIAGLYGDDFQIFNVEN